MHCNETPEDNGEVSAAEVPINHMMDINESDSDFDDISSDDENDRDYQLLATQEVGGDSSGGQQTVYYPHNYSVEWVDWDQYEATLDDEANNCDITANTSNDRSDSVANSQSTASVDTQPNDSSNPRPTIALNDDRINEIKTLMTGFQLPKDNIPVWAQELPEDQWQAFLSNRLEDNKVEDKQ